MKIQKLVPSEIDTVIFPVGTLEAHGSSCIGTDNFIPESIAAGIAGRVNALIAPTVNYGITRSLLRYSGGSGIKPDTLYEILKVSTANNWDLQQYPTTVFKGNFEPGFKISLAYSKELAFELIFAFPAELSVLVFCYPF